MPSIVISGRVMRGKRYGTKLGFPTANLDRRSYGRRRMTVKLGVWAGWAIREKTGKKYRAGIVIGPKDRRGLPALEAHLIGWHGNLYGQRLRLELRTYLRPFRRFQNEKDLRRQIAHDIQSIKKIL